MSSVPAIVLLPGLDGTGDLFGRLLNALGPDVDTRVVAYSRTQPLAYTKLDGVVSEAIPDGRDYVVVAESFSGPLALRHAQRQPDHLAGVVLVASFLRCPLSLPRWSRLFVTPLPFRLPLSGALIRLLLAGHDAPPGLVADVKSAVRSVGSAVLAKRLREIIVSDVTEELGAVNVPLLYLAGDRDRLVPAGVASEMRRRHETMEVITLRAPHLVLQYAAAESAGAIIDFCKNLSD